jgi:biotin carboxyl carrier protein
MEDDRPAAEPASVMQYKAILNGETVEVAFERTSTGIVAVVGGRSYAMEVSTVKPGIFLLNWDSHSIEVSVLTSSDISSVSINGHRIPVEVLDSGRSLQRTTRHAGRSGVSEIRAPMPGKIVRVMMAEGSDAVVGQGIVVMEAMKMQNEIKSPISGRIQKIAVAEGETVRSGDLIAIVEAVLNSE